MTGQRLLGVADSLHEHQGVTSQSPLHAWLRLDRSGCVQSNTAGDGDGALTTAGPYAPYDMQEHGRVVVVQGQPRTLAAHTGDVAEAVAVLDQHPPGMPVGVVIRFPSGSVAIADLWDELVVDVWPGTFEHVGIRTFQHG